MQPVSGHSGGLVLFLLRLSAIARPFVAVTGR
jgi:hypothetical protein